MMASPCPCVASLHETVVEIVHETLVRIAGRELPEINVRKSSTIIDHHDIRYGVVVHDETVSVSLDRDDTNNDPVAVVAAIQQWRNQELLQLARRTVTVRSISQVLLQAQPTHCHIQQPHKSTPVASSSSSSLNKLYNVEIRTPTAMFQRYKQQQQEQQQHENTTGTTTTTTTAAKTPTLTMISAMGVVRTVHSAFELATQHFLPVLEVVWAQHHQHQQQQSQSRGDGDTWGGVRATHHVRVAPRSGFICVATPDLVCQFLQQQQQQQQNDLLAWHACPYCPLWFRSNGNNNKGLWWHLQQQHAQQHHQAMETATGLQQQNLTAMVVYNPQTSTTTSSAKNANSSKSSGWLDSKTAEASPLPSPATTQKMDTATTDPPQRHTRENHNRPPEDPFQCVQRGGTVAELQAAMAMQQRADGSNTTRSTANAFDCMTARDRHGAPLLLWAAGGGHLALVQFLVEQCGCHPDTTIQTGHRAFAGRTALHWAARNGHVSVVDYLLSLAISSSSASSSSSSLNVDYDCPTPSRTVTVTTTTTTTTNVPRQHRLRRRLEATTVDGTTAFCWAAWQGHWPVLQLLHDKYGCRVDTCNQFGCNAVLWAAQGPTMPTATTTTIDHDELDYSECASSRLVQWLEEVGCPTYMVNHSGHGVLHKAAQRGNRRLCEWFVSQRLLPWLLKQKKQCNVAGGGGPGETGEERNDISGGNDSDIFRLIGPDNDECTPSDLAGMEGHQELALYLAQQEMAMAMTAFGDTEASSFSSSISSTSLLRRPVWLSRSDCNFAAPIMTDHFVWEPMGGIFRMRSALTRR